jgi:mercuric ion transport protein
MNHRVWKQNLYAAPSIGLSLLPKIACPACWPAYAGLLPSSGLGFLIPNRAYLLPLTALFLALAVGALAVGACRKRGYAPLAVGSIAAGLILAAKFSLESNVIFYVGLGLLVLVSAWNRWPMSSRCGCAPAAGTLNTLDCTTRRDQ